jgi:hypothetical protein
VPAAIAAGELDAWRVDSYLRVLETLPDVRSWEIARDAGPATTGARGGLLPRAARTA